MTSPTQSPRFFGVDLPLLGREIRAAWLQIQEWPILKGLSPAVAVRLARADGQASVWRIDGDSASPSTADVATARFAAVELAEDDLLLRRIELPPLASGEVAQAVALEVAGASPFPAEDTVWGYSKRPLGSGKLEIQIALASRKRVVQTLPVKGEQGGEFEVWAMSGPSNPIVLGGFGEGRRIAHARIRQRMAVALLVLAAILATAIAVTPVAQARLRALDAQQASNELTKRAEPMIKQRAALMRNIETAQALNGVLVERSEPLLAMDLLTRVLPDDTSLLGLNIQGSKVSITGSTSDAAALMQLLSGRSELREVKAPTPATRPPGTTKDSFNIEFTMASSSPRQKAATATSASAPAEPASGSPAPPGPAPFISPFGGPVPAMPAQQVAPVPQQATTQNLPAPTGQPALQPANPSGASFGGATFGASPPKAAKAP